MFQDRRWPPELKDACLEIVRAVGNAGGRALLVGGVVRDGLMGLDIKDVDVEVYGLTPERLHELLTNLFEVTLVGEAFGVLKIKGHPIDVSIPRRESKAGIGHRGFLIKSDPSMNAEEAARRRDLAINAMAYDLARGELIDPFGGQADLNRRVLRHTSVTVLTCTTFMYHSE